MKKKTAMMIVVLICLLFLPAGCAQQDGEKSKQADKFAEPLYEWGEFTGKTLTVWGRDTDLARGYMKRAFRRYEELTGNTIQPVALSAEEMESAVSQGLKAPDRAPDLVLSFGGTNIEAFDPDNNFYDFSDAVWVDDLTDTSINQTIYRGKVIGLPHWEASISGTIYNQSIFNKLGIEPPRTQEEFMEACETLLKNGITPLYLPCAEPSMMLYQFPLDTLLENGETLHALNEGTTGYADLPEMETILQWYRVMAESGYLGENYMQNDWAGMSDALASGKYAMMLCWDTWLYTDFDGDPSKFGLMPAFMGIPEAGTFEGPNLALLLVNKNGAQVDAAVDFVTFMADPYNYNTAFEGIYTAPVFKRQLASISTPQYVAAERWIEENYRDSTAWLRIRGFSQTDASCILKYMTDPQGYPAQQCLQDMDTLRRGRMH